MAEIIVAFRQTDGRQAKATKRRRRTLDWLNKSFDDLRRWRRRMRTRRQLGWQLSGYDAYILRDMGIDEHLAHDMGLSGLGMQTDPWDRDRNPWR